jgi:hypothetical protein
MVMGRIFSARPEKCSPLFTATDVIAVEFDTLMDV